MGMSHIIKRTDVIKYKLSKGTKTFLAAHVALYKDSTVTISKLPVSRTD